MYSQSTRLPPSDSIQFSSQYARNRVYNESTLSQPHSKGSEDFRGRMELKYGKSKDQPKKDQIYLRNDSKGLHKDYAQQQFKGAYNYSGLLRENSSVSLRESRPLRSDGLLNRVRSEKRIQIKNRREDQRITSQNNKQPYKRYPNTFHRMEYPKRGYYY